MGSFDIINAATFAYRFVVREWAILLRLSVVPVLLGFLGLSVLVLFDWEDLFLRQALIMLPSTLATGWMLAHVVRLIFFGGAPEGETGPDRVRSILAAALVYAVTRFLSTGLMAAAWQAGFQPGGAPPEHPSPATGAAALAFLAVSLWGFRFLWLHIPAALSYPLLRFLGDIRGLAVSFYMLGAWLACFLPVFGLAGMVATTIVSLLSLGHDEATMLARLAAAFLRAAMDTGIATLATAAISTGLRSMIAARENRAA